MKGPAVSTLARVLDLRYEISAVISSAPSSDERQLKAQAALLRPTVSDHTCMEQSPKNSATDSPVSLAMPANSRMSIQFS